MDILKRIKLIEARYEAIIAKLEARIAQLEKPTPLQEWAKKTAADSQQQQQLEGFMNWGASDKKYHL